MKTLNKPVSKKVAKKSAKPVSKKNDALASSKSAKKAVKIDEKNFYAMQAIRELVESGCEQVTIKENKTQSVMWVSISDREEIDALGNAVISNIQKAAGVFKQNCTSFTLAKSGYKCLHIK